MTTSVGEFVHVLIEAVVVVLAVSFISLGLHMRARLQVQHRRVAGLVVGITIPLVLAITFVTMWYWGVGLHKISLGSLIIALGLLVDDAIIAVEMMVRKLEEGYDKMPRRHLRLRRDGHADADGHADHGGGLFAHRPGALDDGDTPSPSLPSRRRRWSSLVRVGVLRALLGRALLLRTRPPTPRAAARDFRHAVLCPLPRLVAWCVEHRWKTIGITVLLFALGLGHGQGAAAVLPDSSRPEILVDLWYPEGSTIQETEAPGRAVRSAHDAGAQAMQSVSTWVGSGVPRFYLPLTRSFRRPTCRSSSCCPRTAC